MKEYKMFPRFVYATIKAIEKNINAGRIISKFFDNPYEAFYWWISEVSIESHKMQGLFKIDYESVIKNTFPNNPGSIEPCAESIAGMPSPGLHFA